MFITLEGNVGSEPEMRYTAQGKAVAQLRMAVSRSDDPNNPLWCRVTAWEKLGEELNELHKGARIRVEGDFVSKPWVGNDGLERPGYEMKAYRFERVAVADTDDGLSDADREMIGQCAAASLSEKRSESSAQEDKADEVPF